ncbi:helix-turn-helix domain-containing protein [Nocardia sp. NPDC049149]|uniref:helix-turn-helix domain-containing protein n=1 Tax=Nocardia sp. NPDC049149 TaxID=3364315 RepID=UPI003723D316
MINNLWTRVEVLALRVDALRLTQEQFAERIGFKPPTIRKWERATKDRPVRGESAQALDTWLARLDDDQRARFRAATVERVVVVPITADRTAALESANPDAGMLDAQGAEDDVVKRRQFGVLLTAALVDSSVPAGSRVGLGDARRVIEAVARLRSREQAIGGVTLVEEAVGRLELAKNWLDTCTFDEAAGRAFMSAVGNLATTTGWLAYDADMHGLARRCYADAFSLANQAGDNDLTVHACLNAASQLITLSHRGQGNPYRALSLVTRARDLVRSDPPGRVHTLIATREAQAYAVLCDRIGFSRAVSRAWRELDFALEHESIDECPEWLRFVNSAEVRCHEARGFGELGQFRKSADLSAGLALDQAGVRNAANYRAGWAASLANVGDVNGAVTQGLSVVDDLEGSVSSTRTLRLLEPVRVAVDDRLGDEFRERFDELVRKAAISV